MSTAQSPLHVSFFTWSYLETKSTDGSNCDRSQLGTLLQHLSQAMKKWAFVWRQLSLERADTIGRKFTFEQIFFSVSQWWFMNKRHERLTMGDEWRILLSVQQDWFFGITFVKRYILLPYGGRNPLHLTAFLVVCQLKCRNQKSPIVEYPLCISRLIVFEFSGWCLRSCFLFLLGAQVPHTPSVTNLSSVAVSNEAGSKMCCWCSVFWGCSDSLVWQN